jgi:hypothetical protein
VCVCVRERERERERESACLCVRCALTVYCVYVITQEGTGFVLQAKKEKMCAH